MSRAMLLLVLLVTAVSAWAQNDITLIANGRTISSDPPATLREGRVYVPLRAAAEAVGGKVEYDAASKRVSICRGTMCTSVLQSEGITIDGRLLIGIRQVGEALNARVDWDGASRTVRITAS